MRCVRTAHTAHEVRKHKDGTEICCLEPTHVRSRAHTVTVPVEERSQNLSVVLHLMLAEATPHCFPVPTRLMLHDVDPLCPEGEDLIRHASWLGLFCIGSRSPPTNEIACAALVTRRVPIPNAVLLELPGWRRRSVLTRKPGVKPRQIRGRVRLYVCCSACSCSQDSQHATCAHTVTYGLGPSP